MYALIKYRAGLRSAWTRRLWAGRAPRRGPSVVCAVPLTIIEKSRSVPGSGCRRKPPAARFRGRLAAAMRPGQSTL